ncbi:hypothetical protein ACUH7Y_24985 [Clostridium beijerinckii]|uniref:hypothetical protein n=1 Tax=Clostridium beijerinckii TaxID=1520 RepID=UPI004042E2AF
METKFQLLMSDDIDALMCYMFQKTKFNRESEYFIDMSSNKAYQNYSGTVRKDGVQTLYSTNEATGKRKDMLALDVSINRDTKSWDNHVVQIGKNETNYNKLSANLNIAKNVNKTNYTDKAIISTFITMLSYYNSPIHEYDKDQLALLCAIDGVYQPFLKGFEKQGTKNLELLGFEFLVQFIKENMQYIQEIDKKYLKDKHIWVNKDGYLTTNLNLDVISDLFNYPIELPKKQFSKCGEFKSKIFNTASFSDKAAMEEFYEKKIFNIALTYKSSGIVSFIEQTESKIINK